MTARNLETPTMVSTSYANSAAYGVADGAWTTIDTLTHAAPLTDVGWPGLSKAKAARRPVFDPRAIQDALSEIDNEDETDHQPDEEDQMERRLVRVIMIDPNENVPTDIALLHDSKEIFTDKTNQELFFDIPIADILKAHNDKRAKLVDKSVRDRTQYLEPARIRDLKMTVVELAKF